VRVALIVPGFSASERDWCIPALLNFVRELARRNEVHVFALRYPHRRDTYRVYGATVHALGEARAEGLGRLPLLARALASIVAHGSRRRFDVLHGLWADEPGFLAATAGRLLGVPVVVALLGGELVGLGDIGYGTQLSRAGRHLVRIALAGATRVTVGSTYLGRLAQPYVPSERLRVMPLGVDTGLFHPDEEKPRRTPLIEGKPNLLRALAGVVTRERGAHLHVVGDGPLRRDLEGLAASLSIARHLTLHGPVPHDRLPCYYRAADLCILTSRHESQGMVTLEAAACGRLTVGTAVGLLPDLAAATGAAPAGDAAELADVILRSCRDLSGRTASNAAARRWVETSYALADTVDAMEAFYRGLGRV